MTTLHRHGFNGPVVYDPEEYRQYFATAAEPFKLDPHGMFPETLDDNIAQQRALGVAVAQAPTGYIRAGHLDALERAIELADRVDRDDFLLPVPFDAEILDDPSQFARMLSLIASCPVPVSYMLGGQFDPLDPNAEHRITAMRSLNACGTPAANFRTDFNAFDLMGRGAFAGAIGSGGTRRHAVAPGTPPFVANSADNSPSVLYPRIAAWWRGSMINKRHGRLRPPSCECDPCDNRSLGRFLSREDAADAKAHNLVIWQQWAGLLLDFSSPAARADFWRTFCQGRVSEMEVLSNHLGLAKPLTARPAFVAWAKL